MNDVAGQDVDTLVLWFVVLHDGAESGVVALVLVLDVTATKCAVTSRLSG